MGGAPLVLRRRTGWWRSCSGTPGRRAGRARSPGRRRRRRCAPWSAAPLSASPPATAPRPRWRSGRRSAGNVAVQSMAYKGKDEIGQLVEAVNTMKTNIRNILLQVKKASLTVSVRSEVLTQSAHEVNQGGMQVSATMEQLSTGAETQANRASELSKNMSTFVTKVVESEKNGQM